MINTLRLTVFLSLTALGFGQEPIVQKSTIWLDTVKRGDMARAVRGLGVLAAKSIAELSIAETQIQEVRPGQPAQLDTRNGLVRGKVLRVVPGVANGVATVEVQVAGALPAGAVPGLNVDGVIDIEVLKDVIHVGRPATAPARSNGVLFKLDPDGQHATRVNVQYGRASVNTIEVLSGLKPGDQVIVSDMSAHAARDRVRLQ
jgi:hypothetical protein